MPDHSKQHLTCCTLTQLFLGLKMVCNVRMIYPDHIFEVSFVKLLSYHSCQDDALVEGHLLAGCTGHEEYRLSP